MKNVDYLQFLYDLLLNAGRDEFHLLFSSDLQFIVLMKKKFCQMKKFINLK